MTTTIIHVTPIEILTRADHDPGDSYPEPIRELRIAAGAKARHESRVRAAELELAKLVSAHEAADGQTIALAAEDIRAAKIIAKLEIRGVGGELGLGLGLTGTARMTWARRLGKGRRNASDGSAWDAALADAFRHVDPALGEITPATLVHAAVVLDGADLLWPQTYAMAEAYQADDPDTAAAWYGAAVRLAVQHLLDAMLDADIIDPSRDNVWGLLPGIEGSAPPRWLRGLMLDAGSAVIEHGLLPGQRLPEGVWPVDLPEPEPAPAPAVELLSRRSTLPETAGSASFSL